MVKKLHLYQDWFGKSTIYSISLVFLLLLSFQETTAQRYWVGGTGNWSDTNHWSTASGGAGGATIPSSSEDAIFDANSFTAGGQIVTLDIDGECRDFEWNNATNSPEFTGAAGRTLTVHRYNFTLIDNMTYSFLGELIFVRNGNVLIELGGASKTLGNMTFLMDNSSTTRSAVIRTTGADMADTYVIGDVVVDSANYLYWHNNSTTTNTNVEFGNIDLAINSNLRVNAPNGGSSTSTFGNITLQEQNDLRVYAITNTFNGTIDINQNRNDYVIFGKTDGSSTNIFNGSVTASGRSNSRDRIRFYNNSTFQSTVTLLDTTEANFYDGAIFNDLVTIGAGTGFADGERCEIQFINNTTFNAGLTVGDYSFIEFGDNDGGEITDAETIFASNTPVTFGNDLDLLFRKNATFEGNVTIGNDCEIDFNGGDNTFEGTVTIGSQDVTGRNIVFNNTNIFEDAVVVNGSQYDYNRIIFENSTFESTVDLQGTDVKASFDNDCTFNGLVTVADNGEARFRESDIFNAGATFGNNTLVRFADDNITGSSTTFNSAAPVTFGTGVDMIADRDFFISGDLSFGDDPSRVQFSGSENIFNGDVDFGIDARANFYNLNTFNGNVTIASVEGGSNDLFRFYGSTFNDAVSITGSSTTPYGLRFYGSEFNEKLTYVDGQASFESSCSFHHDVDIQGGVVYFREDDTFDNTQNGAATFQARNADIIFGQRTNTTHTTTFDVPVTFGTGVDVISRYNTIFNSTVNFEDDITNALFADYGNSTSTTHNDDVTIGQNNTVEYEGMVTFNEPSGTTLLTVGENSTLNLDTRNGDNTFLDITCLEGASINFNPNYSNQVDGSTIRDFILTNFNDIAFNRYNTVTITSMTANAGSGGCEEWIYLHSHDLNQNNNRGLVSFASPQTLTGVIAWKLNVTSSNLTIDYGKDLGRNQGITFNLAPARTVPLDFYWVGGRDGLTKLFGDNENWNNPSNWVAGNSSFAAATNNNGCIPVEGDNVYFNANSFTSAGKQVVVNVDAAFHDMDWTGSLNNPELTESGTYTLDIDGSVTFVAAMTSSYTGAVNYISDEAEVLVTADQTFGGDVTFNNTTGSWQSNGALNCTGTLSLEEGILDLEAFNSNVSCDKFIMNSGADLARTLNYGGTGTISITGNGTGVDAVVDLRGANLTIFPAYDAVTIPQTSNWSIEGTSHSDIQWGDNPLNIGNVTIDIGNNRDAFFYSDAVAADLFTYGNLTITDFTDAFFYGDSKKQYGSMITGEETDTDFDGEEIHFTGDIVYGIENTCDVNGTTNTYQAVTIGSGDTSPNYNFRFNGTNTFNGDVLIDGRCDNTDRIHFYNSTFEQTYTMESPTRARTIGPAIFKGLVTTQDGTSSDVSDRVSMRFRNDATFQGGAYFGDYSWVQFNDPGEADQGTFAQFEGSNTVEFGDYVYVDAYEDLFFVEDASNNAPPVIIGDNTIRFEADENVVVDNTLTIGDNATYIRFCNEEGEGTFGDAVAIGENNSTIYFERDNVFASTFDIGNGSVVQINDNDSISVFQGDVTIGDDADVEFRKKNTFEQNLTIGSNAMATFSQETSNATQPVYTLVQGNVDIQNGATADFRRENEFQGTFDTGSDVYLIFNNSENSTSTFKGLVDIGNNNEGYFERNNIFEAAVTVGNNASLTFNRDGRDTEFQSTLTIGNSGNTSFGRKVNFYDDVLFGSQARSTFTNLEDDSTIVHTHLELGIDNEADFYGDLIFTKAAIDADYEFEIGQRSIVTLNERGSNNEDGVFQDIHLSEEARLTFANRRNSVRNLHTETYNIIELSTHGTTTVTNEFTASVTCNEWLIVRSDISGDDAEIEFTTKKQDWSNIVVQDLTVLGPTNSGSNFPLEIFEGVNLDNLAETTSDGNEIDSGHGSYDPLKTIYLNAERTPKTLYWIGRGTTTPDWSNIDNWSESSGGTISGCIPNPIDSVVFDNNSFTANNQQVIIDIANAACGGFSWVATNFTGIMEGDALNTLQVYSDFSVNDNWDNQFWGTVEFYSAKAISREINQSSGVSPINFLGPITFSASYDISSSPYNWKFDDPIDINDGDTTDIYDNFFSHHQGYVWANGQDINVEGDWEIQADGYFIHGDNTVTFDGNIDNVTIETNEQAFYNLVVNKITAIRDVQIITDDVTIDNDLTITSGRLWDSNEGTSAPKAINATETGTVTITANGSLLLGSNNNTAATSFPNFGTYNLDDASTVYFRHRDNQDQNIQNADNEPIEFGNLVLMNARDGSGGNSGNIAYKYLLAPVTINGALSILNRTTFNDQGNQVTGNLNTEDSLTMVDNATFIVGDEDDGTSLPQFYTYNLGDDSEIIYNSGVAQPIRGIDDGGSSNGSYANLTITNSDSASTSTPVLKTLDNPLRIREAFRIYDDNHVWDEGHQITALSNNSCELYTEINTILTFGSVDSATIFPGFQSDEIFLDLNSTIIYASGASDDQQVRRLANGDNSERSYGNLKFINLDSTAHTNGIVTKTLAASPSAQDGSNTLKVRGDLYIGDYNNVIDAGYQIEGNSTDGGSIEIDDNAILTLGSSTVATLFPLYFDAFDLDANSEVIYNAGVTQTIKGLYNSGDLTANDNYGHITLINSDGGSLINKTLDAEMNVRGNLTIQSNNNLVDDGFQIYGGAATSNTLELFGDASLTLGGDATDSENTVFPIFNTTNLHHGDSPTSTVYYTSNREDAVQEVAGGLDYGNLVITSVNTTVSTEKELQAATNIHGNLDITGVNSGEEIIFNDNGFQITGNATGTVTLGARSTLQLGDEVTATLFPLTYPRDNASLLLDDASTVTYNAGDGAAGIPQLIAGGFDYGNLTLTNPTASSQVNKQLEAAVQIDGSLTINTQNHLIDDGFQITGNADASNLMTMAANTTLTLGKAGAGTFATEFPLLFIRNNTNILLNDASEVIYNAGDDNTDAPQMVAGGFNYGNLTFTNPTAGGNIEKHLQADATIDGDLTINTLNTVFDKGFQFIGNASGDLTIAANSILNIGEGTSATTFPTNFVSANISLDETSTVDYRSTDDQQVSIAPGDGTTGTGYGNLVISQDNSATVIKTLTGSGVTSAVQLKIQGNLTIDKWNHFLDAGYQIEGPDAAGKTLEMGITGNAGGEARFVLGRGIDDAAWDDYATYMPRGWDNRVTGTSTGQIHPTESTVEYRGGRTQEVDADFPYGNLLFSVDGSTSEVGTNRVRKYLKTYNASSDVTIYGDLTIGGTVNLDDDGIQLIAQATSTLTLNDDADLTLGNIGTATEFPQDVTDANIALADNSMVIYNSDQDQDIRALFLSSNQASDRNYGNLTINNPGVGNPTKTILGDDIRIRGDFELGSGNTIDMDVATLNIYLGGHWTNNGGTFTFNQSKVIFEGAVNQEVTSASSKFYRAEIDNNAGILLKDDFVLDGATNGEFIFNAGHVSSDSGNEELVFEDGSSYSGAGANSHSLAKVRKIGADDFTFPVGDGTTGYYNPVGISELTASTEFIAEYIGSNPHGSYDVNSRDTTLHHVSVQEYWMLERDAGAAVASAKVTLHWQNPRTDMQTSSDLRIAHWNGSKWENVGNTDASASGTTGYATSELLSDFSPFTFASLSGLNLLPVELLSFEAKYEKEEGVDLTWKTVNELDNEGFILSRSIGDDAHFEEIASYKNESDLKGRSGNGEINKYSYLDTENLAPGEVHYYRLQQVDFNGEVTTFPIKAVNIGAKVVLYQNYPNPASYNTTLAFSIEKEGRVRLEIRDMRGALVDVATDAAFEVGTHKVDYDLSSYKSGIYVVRMFYGDKIINIKMSVVK
ncbi:T9SS type A sorting domain-containing protein [Flammeovirgaceae bacterium SG7u.111]|nr:T9SS type A sorting domain-containing protein [Flammeovirgaceae bacterium SG7u.132]WPO33736.1 T9SS type A sorting domain-containing protein [Flammeovirgaceae bacterium SG7u.111]